MQSFTARMPFLTATSVFGFGRRRWSSPQQCYQRCLRTFSVNYGILLCEYSVQLRAGLGGGLLDRSSHSVQGSAAERDHRYSRRSHWSSLRQHHSVRSACVKSCSAELHCERLHWNSCVEHYNLALHPPGLLHRVPASAGVEACER